MINSVDVKEFEEITAESSKKKNKKKKTMTFSIILVCFLLFVISWNCYVRHQLSDSIPRDICYFYANYNGDSNSAKSEEALKRYNNADIKISNIDVWEIFLLPNYKKQLKAYENFFDNFPDERVIKKFNQCRDADEAQAEHYKVVEKLVSIREGETPFEEKDVLLKMYYKTWTECNKKIATVLECEESLVKIEHSKNALELEKAKIKNELVGVIWKGFGSDVEYKDVTNIKEIYDLCKRNEMPLIRNLSEVVLYEETSKISDWIHYLDSDHPTFKYLKKSMEDANGYYNYK